MEKHLLKDFPFFSLFLNLSINTLETSFVTSPNQIAFSVIPFLGQHFCITLNMFIKALGQPKWDFFFN